MCPKCQTECRTWGDCIRAKGLRVGWSREAAGFDLSAEKRKNNELALYASARKQGVQPAGTKTAQTRQALDKSDSSGRPYDAGKGL